MGWEDLFRDFVENQERPVEDIPEYTEQPPPYPDIQYQYEPGYTPPADFTPQYSGSYEYADRTREEPLPTPSYGTYGQQFKEQIEPAQPVESELGQQFLEPIQRALAETKQGQTAVNEAVRSSDIASIAKELVGQELGGIQAGLGLISEELQVPAEAVERGLSRRYLEQANDPNRLTPEQVAQQVSLARGEPVSPEQIETGREKIISALAALPEGERQEAIKQISKMGYSSEDKQLKALEESKLKGWEQAISDNADPWTEFAGKALLDPLWLVPSKYVEPFFKPLNEAAAWSLGKVGAGAKKVIGFGTDLFIGKNKMAEWEAARNVVKLADASKSALGEFFASKAPNEDFVAMIGRAMTGDFDPTISTKAETVLKDLFPTIKGDVLKAGGKREVENLMARVLKKYDERGIAYADAGADDLASAFQKAAVNAYRKAAGLPPYEETKGILARGLTWIGQVMKEDWLGNPGFSTAYALTNAPSDFIRGLVTKRYVNPLDYGAQKELPQILAEIGQTVPRSTNRTLYESLVPSAAKTVEGALSKVPVPLVGKPYEFANFVKTLTGVDLVAGKARNLFSPVELSNAPLVKFARGFNLGTSRENFGRFINEFEVNSRVTHTLYELKKTLPEARNAVANVIDQESPHLKDLSGMLRGFQIKSPRDIQNWFRELAKPAPIGRIWEYRPTKSVSNAGDAFLGEVSDALKGLKNPFPNDVTRVFDRAREKSEQIISQWSNALKESTIKGQHQSVAEAVTRSMDDPNLLTRLQEKLTDIRKGYDTVVDGEVRRMEAVLWTAPKKAAPEQWMMGLGDALRNERKAFLAAEKSGADVRNLSEWSKQLKESYISWLRGSLEDMGKTVPDVSKLGDLQALIAERQATAEAIWKNLQAGKYTGGIKSTRMQDLLGIDRDLWEMTGGKTGIDLAKFGEAPRMPEDIAVQMERLFNERLAKGETAQAIRESKEMQALRAEYTRLQEARGVTAEQPQQFPNPTDGYEQQAQQMLEKITGILDDWEQQAMSRLGKPEPAIKVGQAEIDKYTRLLADTYQKTISNAERMTNDDLFDYGVRGGLERLSSFVSPFYKYQTSIIPWAVKAFETHPGLPATAAQYGAASEQDVKQLGLPPRFKGSVPVPRGVSDLIANAWNESIGKIAGTTPVGVDYRVKPQNILAAVFGNSPIEPAGFGYKVEPSEGRWVVKYSNGDIVKPFGTKEAADQWVFDQEKGFTDETPGYVKTLRSVVETGQSLGMRPWPYIDAVLYKLGVYGDQYPSDVLKETALVRAITGVDIEQALKDWESNGAKNNVIGFYAIIELSKKVKDKKLTEIQALEAMVDPNSKEYKDAYRTAQNSADVRTLIRDIIPMTLRSVDPGEMALRNESSVVGVLSDMLQQARDDGDLTRIVAIKQALSDYYDAHPELEVYGARNKTPEELQVKLQTTRLSSGQDEAWKVLQQGLTEDQATYPVGSKARDEAQSKRWELYTRTTETLKKANPLADFSSTRTTGIEMTAQWQNKVIKEVIKAEPYWDKNKYKDYAEYQKAHDDWENKPEVVAKQVASRVLGEKYTGNLYFVSKQSIKDYHIANDSIDQAVDKIYFERYYLPYTGALSDIYDKWRGKEFTSNQRAYEIALFKEKQKQGPDPVKMAQMVVEAYPGRWTAAEIQKAIPSLLKVEQRQAERATPFDKLEDAIFELESYNPPGSVNTDRYKQALGKTQDELNRFFSSKNREKDFTMPQLESLKSVLEKTNKSLGLEKPDLGELARRAQAEAEMGVYQSLDKNERRNYWNTHPIMSEYYGSDTPFTPRSQQRPSGWEGLFKEFLPTPTPKPTPKPRSYLRTSYRYGA